jgi:hypothetical protein
MGQRSELHTILKSLVPNVYFQPPETVKMVYPCIVYRRDDERSIFADNKPYKHTKRYQVTVIDTNPDSDIPRQVAALPMCVFDRFFTANQLNHDVYTLFF